MTTADISIAEIFAPITEQPNETADEQFVKLVKKAFRMKVPDHIGFVASALKNAEEAVGNHVRIRLDAQTLVQGIITSAKLHDIAIHNTLPKMTYLATIRREPSNMEDPTVYRLISLPRSYMDICERLRDETVITQ